MRKKSSSILPELFLRLLSARFRSRLSGVGSVGALQQKAPSGNWGISTGCRPSTRLWKSSGLLFRDGLFHQLNKVNTLWAT